MEKERAQLLTLIPHAALAETVPEKHRPVKSPEALRAYLPSDVMLANFVEGERDNYLLGIHAEQVFAEAVDKTAPAAALASVVQCH